MTNTQRIQKTAEHVKTLFSDESTGHDWWHMYRVWQLAKQITVEEPSANTDIVELAALLHDIADWKFHDGDLEAGPKVARAWLTSLGTDEDIIMAVEDIVRTVSFKGAGVPSSMKTIEGKIIHDADKLDAIGAIGIARAFAYGGAHQRPLHDPNASPEFHKDFAEYKKSKGPTVHHFHEKLLLLKDRMYTDAAKRLAAHRHDFMEAYLEEFHQEWSGQK